MDIKYVTLSCSLTIIRTRKKNSKIKDKNKDIKGIQENQNAY